LPVTCKRAPHNTRSFRFDRVQLGRLTSRLNTSTRVPVTFTTFVRAHTGRGLTGTGMHEATKLWQPSILLSGSSLLRFRHLRSTQSIPFLAHSFRSHNSPFDLSLFLFPTGIFHSATLLSPASLTPRSLGHPRPRVHALRFERRARTIFPSTPRPCGTIFLR
jgi:hypothetical protein